MKSTYIMARKRDGRIITQTYLTKREAILEAKALRSAGIPAFVYKKTDYERLVSVC